MKKNIKLIIIIGVSLLILVILIIGIIIFIIKKRNKENKENKKQIINTNPYETEDSFYSNV